MSRTKISPVVQPDETSCGPATLKASLKLLNISKSMKYLTELCRTNRNGTSTKNLISAANKIGLYVLALEYTTLRQLQIALRSTANTPRVCIVSYLSEKNPIPDSGHWAMVSSFLPSKSRILLLDSYIGKKISYDWVDFRKRWKDFDLKRRKINNSEKKFTLIRKWQPQLMLVLAKNLADLPKFKSGYAKLFQPV